MCRCVLFRCNGFFAPANMLVAQRMMYVPAVSVVEVLCIITILSGENQRNQRSVLTLSRLLHVIWPCSNCVLVLNELFVFVWILLLVKVALVSNCSQPLFLHPLNGQEEKENPCQPLGWWVDPLDRIILYLPHLCLTSRS